MKCLTRYIIAYRSELAWKEVCNSVTEVKNLISEMTAISSHFHKSGIRTRELKDIASRNKFNLVTLPKVFEVRWTEFTKNLLNAILISW